MIDFEFEFQYAEEKQPTLQKSAAASQPDAVWCSAAAAAAESPHCYGASTD